MPLSRPLPRLCAAFALACVMGPVMYALIPSLPTRLLSGIAAGAIVFRLARRSDPDVHPHALVRRVGQIMIAIRIAFAIDLLSLVGHLPVVGFDILIALFMIFSGMAVGLVYARLAKQDLLAALLATLPGGVGVMSSIAADYGLNVTAVAMVQVSRVTAVVMLVAVISAFTPVGAAYNGNGFFSKLTDGINVPDVVWFAAIYLAADLFARLARRMKIPAGPFFGSIVAGLIANWALLPVLAHAGIDLEIPPIFSFVGQLFLGIAIGEAMASEFVMDRLIILYGSFSVILTIGIGCVVALIAHETIHTDWMTSILLAAPGGAIEMMTLALAVKTDLAVIASAQVIRLLAINLLLPVWLGMFRYVDTLATRATASEPPRS